MGVQEELTTGEAVVQRLDEAAARFVEAMQRSPDDVFDAGLSEVCKRLEELAHSYRAHTQLTKAIELPV
jgi:hypothetical protein